MFINKGAENKHLRNNILAIASEAIEAKKADPEVINATAGMMKHEDGSLYEFSSVQAVIDSLNLDEKLSYANSAGSPEFHQAVLLSLFGKFLPDIEKECFLDSIPTPGGSGALNLAFSNYIGQGESILLPNYMWENYLNYATELGLTADTYRLFDDNGRFGGDDLEAKIKLISKRQKRIMILINDPCENPTGFCMKDEDYDRLIGFAKKYPSNDFVYLIDVAYFDFYNADPNIIRCRFAKFKDIPSNAMALYAFSGSKSFGLYGLRIGSLVALSKDEEEIRLFKEANNFSCRARWSSASTLGMSIIEKLVLDERFDSLYEEEVRTVCKALEKRSLAFLEAAKEVGLKTLPYERGFFICIPVDDPVGMRIKLHEDKVYLVSTSNCLRVALCAISKEEAARLPQIIKRRLSM